MILKKGIATVLSSATILTAVSPCAFAEGNNSEEKHTKSMSTTGKVLLGAAGAISLAAVGGIIYHAVKNSHVEVETLKGKPIYGKYMELKNAVINCEYYKVEKLLNENKDLDINAVYLKGTTLLHLAVIHFRKDICELLIYQGAYIDAKDQYGETPLYKAVFTSNVEACRVLIKNDANVNIRTNSGETPFSRAVRRNSKQICELFFDKYGVDDMDLNYAALFNSTNVCELLIDKYHINVNNVDAHGNTPLANAFFKSAVNVCKLLIKKGADVNVRVNNNATPLHKAVLWNCLDLCKLLLEKGADINAKDNYGFTPLDYANNHYFKISDDVKTLLIKKGAKHGNELK